MNDTISRVAAIAVADSSDYVGLSVDDVKKVTDEVVKGLKRLPSAQPELVRCKDCEFYTEGERWCRRLGLCGAFDPNGYCSHAERRTDGKTQD